MNRRHTCLRQQARKKQKMFGYEYYLLHWDWAPNAIKKHCQGLLVGLGGVYFHTGTSKQYTQQSLTPV